MYCEFNLSLPCLIWLCTTFVPVYTFRVSEPKTPQCTSESHVVQACFHTYMERDIEEVMGIVYPHGKKSVCNADGTLRGRSDADSRMIATNDMISLVAQCNKIHQVYNCLEKELVVCDQIYSFFSLRHVLYSMRKSITWLCGQPDLENKQDEHERHQEVEDRFSVLLKTVHCVECKRVSNIIVQTCYKNNKTLAGDLHIWLQILRLQRDPDICFELQKELRCFLDTISHVTCGEDLDVYKNVTRLFVDTWCNEHPFRSVSHGKKSESWILVIGILFSALNFRKHFRSLQT